MKIIAISDQHGYLDNNIPECDLLLVAGDITPDSKDLGWFMNTWLPWRQAQPARHVIATWGNHDRCGRLGRGSIWEPTPNTQVVIDDLVEFEGLKIWATPRSRSYDTFNDAFTSSEENILAALTRIPEGIDILVSHAPPYGYGDKEYGATSLGSKSLLETIGRVKPKVVVCGHIHGGYGHYEMAGGTQVYNVAQIGSIYEMGIREPVEINLERREIL